MKKNSVLKATLILSFILLILWFVNTIYEYIYLSELSFPDLLLRNISLKNGTHSFLFLLIITTIISITFYISIKVLIEARRKKTSFESQLIEKTEKLTLANNKLLEYSRLFESVKHPIIVLDKNQNCSLVNPSFLQFFELEKKSVKNHFIDHIIKYPKLLISLKESMNRVEKSQNDEFEVSISQNDQLIDFSVSIYSSIDQMDNTETYVIIFCNITERKKNERMKALNNQQLEESNKMTTLGTLSVGMAHEINNPNNSIMMNASLLQRIFSDMTPFFIDKEIPDCTFGGFASEKIEEKIEIMLTGILSGSERIKHITDELRDFARKDTGKFEKVNINEVIMSSLNKLDHLLAKKSVSINVELNKGRPIYTRGIFYKIEQVFNNLLTNAFDSLQDKDNSMEITAGIDQKIRKIIILINDTGSGMDKETLAHIRDPFFTTKRNIGGIGLGLSTTSRIIEEHGGTLDFISKPDSGTTAIIHFPLWEDLIN